MAALNLYGCQRRTMAAKAIFWVIKNLVANLVSLELELLNKVIFDVGSETKNLGQRNKESSWVFTTGLFQALVLKALVATLPQLCPKLL